MRNMAQKAMIKSGASPEALADALSSSKSIAEGQSKKSLDQMLKKAAASSAAGASSGADPFNFNFADPAASGTVMGMDDGPGEDLAPNMVIENSDIMSNPNGDIFQMLTIRYMKSAYPVFFEEGAVRPTDTLMDGKVEE